MPDWQIVSPISLLFFGYYELGYLAMNVGVVPLLALGNSRRFIQASGPRVRGGTVLVGLSLPTLLSSCGIPMCATRTT